jgi:hypothetical protein
MYEGPHKVYRVYITASRPRGALYVGMTSELLAHGSIASACPTASPSAAGATGRGRARQPAVALYCR